MTISAVDDARLSERRFYHPELDVLRFFAFCMVFAGHSFPAEDLLLNRGFPNLVHDVLCAVALVGQFGVDVFFALSAYLITELLLREKVRFCQVDVRSFYIRRILRIWPLYFAFLFTATAGSGWLTGKQDSLGTVAAFTFLVGNWWVVFRGWPSLGICPLWSVSVEEQFYLVWPLLVRRLNSRQLLLACGLLLIVASSAQIYLGMNHTPVGMLWCNTLVHLDPIALGSVAAILLRGRTLKLAGWLRLPLFASGFGLIVIAACYLPVDDRMRPSSIFVGFPLVALGSVIMLIAILSETPPWFARGPLVYLGRISYGLYVCHLLILSVVGPFVDRLSHSKMVHGGMPIAFLLTIVVAALSYRYLESPFLRIKERFARIPSHPVG